jgi:hypothetical protein
MKANGVVHRSGSRGFSALPAAGWLLLELLATTFPLNAAMSQTSTWHQKTGGDWSVPTNWTPSNTAPNSDTAEVVFPTLLSGTATITLDKTYSLSKLEIANDSSGAGDTIQSSNGKNGGLKFFNDPRITIPGDNKANNTIALPVIIANGQRLQIANDSDALLTVSGVISGAGANGLLINGDAAGGVLLSGKNTYKGKTIVLGGRLLVKNNAALGPGRVDVQNGGVLQGSGATGKGAASLSKDRTIVIGGVASEASSGALQGAPDGGIFTVNAKIESNAAGSDLNILNSVRLTNTANSFTTSTGILVGNGTTAGKFYLEGADEAKTDRVMGNPNNGVSLANGSTIVDQSTFTTNRQLHLNPFGTPGEGTIAVIGNKTLTWTGAITGKKATLAKTGAGTLVLQGNNGFAHLKIEGGAVAAVSAANLASDLGIANGAKLQVNAPFATAGAIAIHGSGVIDANFAANPAQGKDFNVMGVVSGGTFIKQGTGIVTLSNAKNTQSATIIRAGALAVSADEDLGPTSSTLTIGAGVLRVTQSFATERSIVDIGNTKAGEIFVAKGKTFEVKKGIMAKVAAFTKSGGGTLELAASSTTAIGAAAKVEAGKLLIDEGAEFDTNTPLVIAKGAKVSGSGAVKGNVVNYGKVNPGKDPGTLAITDDVTMETDSQFGFDINAANGGAAGGSLGWGLLNVGGQLDLLGAVTLDLQTYDLSGDPGPMAPSLFDPSSSYSWEFASASGGVTGFSPSLFHIDGSGFENQTAPGMSFSVVEQGDALYLDYGPRAAVPEPRILVLLTIGAFAMLVARKARHAL